MARYRDQLPQLSGTTFLTDGGIETDLIFNKGAELPDFAAFTLLAEERGQRLLDQYFRENAEVARQAGVGFVLESATWRANPDWAAGLGYDRGRLGEVNRQAIDMLAEIRAEFASDQPMVISGCVGPRGDGYQPGQQMSADEAHRYHQVQADMFAGTEADQLTAITMTYPEEAIGVARAARDAGMPVVLSFTVETDGRLPNASTLADAISSVDEATDGYPAYYMINCAHPTHFTEVLDPAASWTSRIRGLRANASRASHAELDESPTLDAGDPTEFGRLYAQLREAFPQFTVLGGCCGTDVRHIREVASECIA
ncbi:MAG TPA: homocysteine S-methyltransferase family protein [Micromonosporaceae bacterium]